jgi:cyclophilin family peptidyl-prolyl cis-trans isomerase
MGRILVDMRNKNHILSFILVTASLFSLVACSGNSSASSSSSDAGNTAPTSSSSTTSSKSSAPASSASSSRTNEDVDKPLGYQLDKPAKGEDIAVLTTSMGTIKMRLFPNASPKSVENFKGLIQKGYYNGLLFHRVIKDFMVQSGDPNGDGTGGTSLWNKTFEDEFNKNLVNIKGAVAMANSGPNTNGSQFFIDQAGPSTFSGWDYYTKAFQVFQSDPNGFVQQYQYPWVDMSKATKDYENLYLKNGGNPGLDGAYNIIGRGHTVFAQVYEGMDVVDKIASVSVDSNDKPTQEVKIVKAEIQKYQG